MIINKTKRINKDKQKELLLYLIFGFSTTMVNILIFRGLMLINVDYKIANLFAVVFGKLYAYITNKRFVFRTICNSFSDAVKEFLRFVYARGVTGLIDYFGLIVAVEWLHFNPVWSKYGLQFLIIILNYILSKLIIFRTKENRGIRQ